MNNITIELKSNKVIDQYDLMLTSESGTDGNPCAAALIFDGANRGRYTGNAVVDLAREYGWKDAPEQLDTACGDQYEDDDVTDAEDYLNELTPDGYSFGFDDGSFHLANDAWWSLVSS